MKRLLLATDGSEYSRKAAEHAYEFLDVFPEATLTILYVTAKETYAYDLIPEVVERAEENIKKEIKKQMEETFSPYLDRIHFKHEVGHPSATICDVAKQEEIDMIIVGSHGKGIIDRALVGSVAHGVLHRAHVPVLIVKD